MHGGRARGGTAREIVLRKEQPAKWPQMTHRQFPQMRESCDRRPRAEAPAILGWVHIGCLAPAASRLMAVGYGRDCVGRPWGLLAAAMANVGTRRKVVAGAMAVGLTRHGRGSGRGDREGPSVKRREPFGTCRAEAEAGCEVMVLKVDAQPTGCLMLAAARGVMMGCEADGGTDVADVPPRLQGRSVEEGCKAGGGQLAPGAVAAGLGCGQELGGGCKAGSSRP